MAIKEEGQNNDCSDIYPILRDRIALMEYEPGKILQEDELVDEFNCSRTPVRKAFIRLEDRGLIRRVPKKGTYVAPIDCQSFKDHFKVRKFLLKLVSDLVISNIKPGEIDRLKEVADKMSEKESLAKLVKLDLEFHRLLYSAMNNDLMEQIMGMVLIKTFRIWLLISEKKVDPKVYQRYSKLIGAIDNGDADKVEEILIEHSQKAVAHMRQELEEI